MNILFKALLCCAMSIAGSQFVQATDGGAPIDDDSKKFFVYKANFFSSPEDVHKIAADCDQLINLWNDFATGAFIRREAPLGEDAQVDDACKLFIENFIALHVKITEALLALPKELWRYDVVLASFAFTYVEKLCPVLCKKVLNKVLNRFFPDYTHFPIVLQVAILHYITCSILHAGVPAMQLKERKERSFIALADGLARFMREDGVLKTPEEFAAEEEALDLKEYFEHWYGNAAFVAPVAGGGEGAAVGQEDVEEAAQGE